MPDFTLYLLHSSFVTIITGKIPPSSPLYEELWYFAAPGIVNLPDTIFVVMVNVVDSPCAAYDASKTIFPCLFFTRLPTNSSSTFSEMCISDRIQSCFSHYVCCITSMLLVTGPTAPRMIASPFGCLNKVYRWLCFCLTLQLILLLVLTLPFFLLFHTFQCPSFLCKILFVSSETMQA